MKYTYQRNADFMKESNTHINVMLSLCVNQSNSEFMEESNTHNKVMLSL